MQTSRPAAVLLFAEEVKPRANVSKSGIETYAPKRTSINPSC